jgi:GNAT superfamily N-acetyltransferase
MTCVHCGKPVPAGVEVQRRPLTFLEAQTVMRQISYSRFITGYSLREWTGGRDTFVLLRPDSGRLLGALLVHHLRGGWSEIAVVFILEEHRSKGHGRCLLQSSVRTLKWTSEKLLLFFSERTMDRLVRDVGFEIFANENDLVRGKPGRWVFMKIMYKVQWLCNWYRIRELMRKKREFGCDFQFKVALLESDKVSRTYGTASSPSPRSSCRGHCPHGPIAHEG